MFFNNSHSWIVVVEFERRPRSLLSVDRVACAMSGRPDVRNRNYGNNTEANTSSASQGSPNGRGSGRVAEEQDYILLHRSERLSTFFKSMRHWWKSAIEVSGTMKRKKVKIQWRYILSQALLDILYLCTGLLAFIGKCVEFPFNVYYANGGSWLQVIKYLFNGQLIVPRRDDPTYRTLIMQLDPRTKLYVDKSAAGQALSEAATSKIFPGTDDGARSTADVLVMASKLAYENESVIKKVVTEDWNMHFVGFYSCWNEFLQEHNTQVFVFTDRAEDANAIVIAWRGTEPFNAMDWSTDFDFSWYNLEGMGCVHVGFLEALGLASRNRLESFQTLQQKANAKCNNTRRSDHSTSGLSPDVIQDSHKLLAYDHITEVVRGLLSEHPGAKLYGTGHSLGGALATLYTAMLFYNDEKNILKKLAAVYTFGQPRVGDEAFAQYMRDNVTHFRYFRVVYCNDLVPRVPFDDKLFAFKHFGLCFYYNSRYIARCLREAPRKNYFYLSDILTVRITAIGELINAFRRKDADFAESWPSIMSRLMALLVPGVGGHSPVNYVNAVRLGPSSLVSEVTDELHEMSENLHDWEEKFRGAAGNGWNRAMQAYRRWSTPH